MTDYELVYLNFGARATPIRLMLTYLGIPFKNSIYDFDKDEWAKVRKTLPFEEGPVLIIDKTFKLAHGPAILHYLGKEYGLEPEENKNQALAEMFAHQCQDAFLSIRPWLFTIKHKLGEEKFNEAWKNTAIPQFKETFAKFFETRLQNNGSGFVVGEKLSWVDFLVANITHIFDCRGKDPSILDDYPYLKQHLKTVFYHPKLLDAVKKEKENYQL